LRRPPTDLRGLPQRVADRPALLLADHRPTLRLPSGAPACCPDRLTPASSPGVGPTPGLHRAPGPSPLRRLCTFFRRTVRASTPGHGTSPSPSASGCHPEVPFRPRGFSPPRRVSPRSGSQACCILQPTLGFAAFHTDRPKPAAILATRPPLEGCSHPLVALRSPGALAPLAFALERNALGTSLLTRPERPETRPAPSRHCPRGWSVTFALLAERRTPCPSWASVSSSRSRRPRGRAHRPVTGERSATRPPSLLRGTEEPRNRLARCRRRRSRTGEPGLRPP
jgi:hypothetical protein